LSGFFNVKNLPNSLNCAKIIKQSMAKRILPFTIPVIKKGKEVKNIPKGSSKAKEIAKQTWHVEFFFYNEVTNKNERFRYSKGLNNIDNPLEKAKRFEDLRGAYQTLLEKDWSPVDEKANEQLKKSMVSITIHEAAERFKEYHAGKQTRPTTLRSYISKIKQFIDHVGRDKKVIDITDFNITDYLNTYESKAKWTGLTYNYGRTSLNNLFKFLKINKYVAVNPVTDLERRKEVKTEKHQVFHCP